MLSPTLSNTKSDIDYIPCVDVFQTAANNTTSLGPVTLVNDTGTFGLWHGYISLQTITASATAGTITGRFDITDGIGTTSLNTGAVAIESNGRTTLGTQFVTAANTTIAFRVTQSVAAPDVRWTYTVALEKIAPS